MPSIFASKRSGLLLAAAALAAGLVPAVLEAHGVSGKDAVYLQGLDGRAIVPLMYLGAKHMVTGYDHLLFLVGVIFFLYRLKDVVQYVTLFTIGHSITLLAGVLGGIRANPYLIDAIIGFSVVYKAFENMGGFTRVFGVQPNTRVAVLVFGLFHGFGLATKLQEFALSPNGLVGNIVSFNVGVEIGQGLALTAILIGLMSWRSHAAFLRHAFATNAVVMACGFLLLGYQLSGYFLAVPWIMTTLNEPLPESRERLAIAAGAAILVAGLLLVTVVLPAEYAVDPLGTGARLGLLDLGVTGQQVDALNTAASTSPTGTGAIVVGQPKPFARDEEAFVIAPRKGMEYKYRLEKGEALLYSWTATAPVHYEFHAEPDGAPRGYAQTYEKQDAVADASGTLTAPFPGIHGWYWENRTDRPVTVTLRSAGFYNLAHEFRADGVKNKTF